MAGFNAAVAPPSSSDSIAQWVMTQTEHVLSAAINEPMQRLFEALMPVIVVGLTIQFVVYAFALMHGQGGMSVAEFFKKAIMVAIISMFFGAAGLFQTTIADTMIALPDDMTSIVVNGDGIAQQIDGLLQDTSDAANAMQGASDDSWFSFLPSSREVIVAILSTQTYMEAAIVGSIIMVLVIVCKVGMALVVAAGPIFIAALLFEPTKRLFNGWVSQALNFTFLALLAGLVSAFLIQMNIELIRMIGTQVQSGITDILSLVAAQMLVSVASVIIMLMLPGLAGGLSGGFGANFGVGAAGRGAFTALRVKSMLRPRLRPPGAG